MVFLALLRLFPFLDELFVALSIVEIDYKGVSKRASGLTDLSQTGRGRAGRSETFLWTRDIASNLGRRFPRFQQSCRLSCRTPPSWLTLVSKGYWNGFLRSCSRRRQTFCSKVDKAPPQAGSPVLALFKDGCTDAFLFGQHVRRFC